MTLRELKQDVLAILDESTATRIHYVQKERWIGYKEANDILKRIERLFRAPRKGRVKSLIVVGPPNSGKTALKDKFLRTHPEYENEDGSCTIFPILHIEAPERADPKALAMMILDELGADYSDRTSFPVLSKQATDLLEETQVKMLLIDEIHNFLAGGKENRKQVLNMLRRISNKLKISIVAFGTPEALKVIASEPQLSSRFKREFLPSWYKDSSMLTKMLKSLEMTLPLRKISNLHHEKIRNKLLQMSEGILGEIVDILEEATIKAIESGTEKITLEVLKSLGWLSPSERENYSVD